MKGRTEGPWELRRVDDVVIVDLDGKLTSGTPLRELVRELTDRGLSRILVNLRGVRYIGTAAVGEFVVWHTTAKDAGGQLKLMNAKPRHLELFERCDLLSVFEFFEDEQEAVESFGR